MASVRFAVLEWKRTVSFRPCPVVKPSRLTPTPRLFYTSERARSHLSFSALQQWPRRGSAQGLSAAYHVNSVIAAGPSETAFAPADGIYIYKELLTTNAPGFTNSLPFWVVMNNNITEDQRSKATVCLYPNLNHARWAALQHRCRLVRHHRGAGVQGTQPVPVPQSPNSMDGCAWPQRSLRRQHDHARAAPRQVGTIDFKSVPHYTLAGPSSLTLQSGTTAGLTSASATTPISGTAGHRRRFDRLGRRTASIVGDPNLEQQQVAHRAKRHAQLRSEQHPDVGAAQTLRFPCPAGCVGYVRGASIHSSDGMHKVNDTQEVPERQRRQHRRREGEQRHRNNVGRGGESLNSGFDKFKRARYRRHVVQSGDRNDRCLGLARQSIK